MQTLRKSVKTRHKSIINSLSIAFNCKGIHWNSYKLLTPYAIKVAVKLLDVKNRKDIQEVKVTEFHGPSLVIERLHELGFHKGCTIKILGVAPFKGPLLIEINTTVLALRDEESQCLLIQI